VENAYVESFHSRFRDECLSTHRVCDDPEGDGSHHPTLSLTLDLSPQKGEDQTKKRPFSRSVRENAATDGAIQYRVL
jgi:hypothetical protein